MKKRNSTELKRRMSGRWLAAFSALAPSLDHAIQNLGNNVPCPVYGGTDGFRLFHDADNTGGGVKQSWRVIPEGIDMLMWVNGWSFIEAFDELESWLGGKPIESKTFNASNSKPKPKPKPVNETGMRKWLNSIWKEALPLNHLKAYPARAYFNYRRVNTAALSANDVRFHPNLIYRDRDNYKKIIGKFGAIIAIVRNNDDEPISIYRMYITKGGLKVNLDDRNKPRKMTSPVHKRRKGRYIRLFSPQNGYLGLSEGLETALAVYQVKNFPVWPGISNTNVQSFEPPKGVHTILNFVDKDRNKAGENSAEILRANLEPKGIRVIDLLPPTPITDKDEKGVDWADQLFRDIGGFDLIDQALDFSQLKHA